MGPDLVLSVDNICAGLYQVFCVSNTDMISRDTLKKVRTSNGFYSEMAILADFLDLSRLLGRVMRSELVLSV